MNENRMLDRIYIREIKARAIIGINQWERENRQDLQIDVTLHADLASAAASDRIEDTVDYKKTKDRIVDMVEQSSFFLIERVADTIARLCLEDSRVERVDVTVDKPGALRFARSVAIGMTRTREDVRPNAP